MGTENLFHKKRKQTTEDLNRQKQSACTCVTDDLKPYIPAYTKGSRNTFIITIAQLDKAIKHAEALEKDRESAGTDNPSTNVHHLIKYLYCELGKQLKNPVHFSKK